MANRAYLYAADRELNVLRDVSEWRSEVPFFYRIVLGVNTKLCHSQIWSYEKPICIMGDMKAGLERLDAFYEYLKTQSWVDALKIETYQRDTREFFAKHPERVKDVFFMEGGEAYDLVGSDTYPIEKENERVYNDVLLIAGQLSEIIASKPANLLEHAARYGWLADLQKDIAYLEPYWTHVTYFSFNKTGTA